MFLNIRWIIKECQIPTCLVKYDSAPGTLTEGHRKKAETGKVNRITTRVLWSTWKKKSSFQDDVDISANEPQFLFILFTTNLKETQN